MRSTIIFSLVLVLSLLNASEDIIEESDENSNISSNTCSVPNKVIEAIAKIERHAKRPIGYPYIIAFNSQDEASIVKTSLGKDLFLDWRTIDCKNETLCVKILSYITHEHKFNNLDLGSFQINYKYHQMPVEQYFSFEKSYFKACGFLEKLIQKNGYSWETIARYHSSTPQFNYAYLQKISKTMKETHYD